ncbi:PQQ-dependent sugar dehydrogenase [Metabacillus iocasae]|uniref:Glucose/arabinose dehydrogenase n=1 Tax=Priestia iocasae TaxID=2291674 RepID=A0ABS2QW53_9BACI|nr:PQQ-dependent sugar dehydrogenase [Metabacillus iocasae]MBM7703701.1 glucose/arabinose dehydrogenase [Metabacillus iocasae]
MIRKMLPSTLAVFLLISCSAHQNEDSSPSSSPEIHSTEVVKQSETNVLTEKLSAPWSIAKHQNVLYISSRNGKIIKLNEETKEKTAQSLSLIKDIHVEGEGGFLGFIIAPHFKQTKQAYAYHTYKEGSRILNRVILMEEQNNVWVEKQEMIGSIPGARFHNGGRIKIGPDNKLYVTTGDALEPSLAQNLESLAGKILRINLDGTIPVDNPYKNSYVYSYGHRNPQGLAWDSNGTLYSTEHGQQAHDEINHIQAGKNYGWPIIEGDEQASEMVTPLFHTGNETWAPSGISYENGYLYIATLAGSSIVAFNLADKKPEIFFDGEGRMRDTLIDNGQMYWISNNTDGRGAPADYDDRLYKTLLPH